MKTVLSICVFAIIVCNTVSASSEAIPNQNAFSAIWANYLKKVTERDIHANSGRFVGDSSAFSGLLINWMYRDQCYEIYFASQEQLARSIFGLAISSGDVKADMTLEYFIKGAQGFHYDINQVCDWINKINRKEMLLHTSEERHLINWLLEDSVITISHCTVKNNGLFSHLSGASPGKKRSLMKNLTHERLHVMWDEDQNFQMHALKCWEALSMEERSQVYTNLPGYSKDREMQIIEEWWVRLNENLPERDISQLLGTVP